MAKVGSTFWSDIFEVGVYRGTAYTLKDLKQFVANFQSQGTRDVPLVIGHDEDQALLEKSDLPAAGWVTALKIEGRKLMAKFTDVPKIVQQALEKKRYGQKSIEFQTDKDKGRILRRVALLGGIIPEVSSLEAIVALENMDECTRVFEADKEQKMAKAPKGSKTKLSEHIDDEDEDEKNQEEGTVEDRIAALEAIVGQMREMIEDLVGSKQQEEDEDEEEEEEENEMSNKAKKKIAALEAQINILSTSEAGRSKRERAADVDHFLEKAKREKLILPKEEAVLRLALEGADRITKLSEGKTGYDLLKETVEAREPHPYFEEIVDETPKTAKGKVEKMRAELTAEYESDKSLQRIMSLDDYLVQVDERANGGYVIVDSDSK